MKYKSWGTISSSKRLCLLKSLCHKSLHFFLSFVIIFQSTVSFPQVQDLNQPTEPVEVEEDTPQPISSLLTPIEYYDASVPLIVHRGSFSVASGTYLNPPIEGEDYTAETKLGHSIYKLQDSEFMRDTIYELHNALIEKIRRIEIEQGENADEYFRRVAGTKATPKITESIGTAELSRIDGTFLIRVIHHQTDTVFYILDEVDFLEGNDYDPDFLENHYYLRQLKARQHLMGGTNRLDYQRGRDVIFLWKDDLRNTRTVVSPRIEVNIEGPQASPHILPRFQDPEIFQALRKEHRKLRRREYRDAISSKFTIDNLIFAIVAGVIQAGIVFSMGFLKGFVFGEDIEFPDILDVATLSFIFTFLIYLFPSSFRYLINMGKVGLLQKKPIVDRSTGFLGHIRAIDWKGTFTSKIARNGLISLTYSYLFLFLLNEEVANLDISIDNIPIFFDLFLKAQILALPNFVINNISKTWWTEQAHINEIAGRTNKKISIFGIKLDAANWDFSVVKYNISQIPKLAHLLNIGLPAALIASTSSTGIFLNMSGINLGFVGMLVSIVLGQYFLLKKVFNLNLGQEKDSKDSKYSYSKDLEDEQLWHYSELLNQNNLGLGRLLFEIESLRREFLIWWHELHIRSPELMNDFYKVLDILRGKETDYQTASHDRETERFKKRERSRRILSRIQTEIEFYKDKKQIKKSLKNIQINFLKFLNQRHTQILAPAVKRQIMISFDNFAKAVHALFETVKVSSTFNHQSGVMPWNRNSDDRNIWDRSKTIEQEDILNFFEKHLTERFPHLRQALSFTEAEDEDSISSMIVEEVEGPVILEDVLKELQFFMKEHFGDLAQYIEEQEMKNFSYNSGSIIPVEQTKQRNFNYSRMVPSPAEPSVPSPSEDAVCASALNTNNN